MQTYLGACTELGVADVTGDTVGYPDFVLLEGYVWDIPEGPGLAAEAIRIAKGRSARIALSLSDSLCVQRHREEFREAVLEPVDIVFADEDEAIALLEVDDFDGVARTAPAFGKLFVVTRSEKGSVVIHGDVKIVQQAIPVSKVVDTTGAGDAYVAGFLYGLANGKPLDECARLGTRCATGVIQKVGARIDRGMLQASA
jgi:sugar/nucleoside kinase (ribokinase family)